MKRQLGLIWLFAGLAMAQPPQPPQPAQPAAAPQPPGGPPPMPARVRDGGPAARPMQPSRPPMERALMPGMPGRWWDNPQMVQKLGINSDQQKKMDVIFLANRIKLVDLNATLQKEEITMEPLVSADTPDEALILAQIDKVAQTRAELEKANARFLLGIRRVLTPDQWKKLQAERPGPGGFGGPGPGGPGNGAGMPRPAEGPRPLRK
jgi:periplasmic protein CpxP/Spy